MCSPTSLDPRIGVPGKEERSNRGFALIASLMALWILMALGVLVFTVTTQDVRISSRSVGEKKAFSAAESGVGWLTENFNPADLSANRVTGPKVIDENNRSLIDTASTFTIAAPTPPLSGPATLPY